MADSISTDLETVRRRVLMTIHGHWKRFLVQGVLMIFLGMLAIALPNIFTLAIELMVGWLFIIGGFLRVATIFRKNHMPGFWWSLLNGVLAVVLGAILIARPLQGMVTLTIILSVFFVFEGIAAIFIALDFRRYLDNWGWILLGGVINLALAYLIWSGWPNTARWIIGLYVGLNMIFLGVPLLMTAVAARNLGSSPK